MRAEPRRAPGGGASRPPRVLLVDCLDSFTLNLAHDVAAVTGALPRIVTLRDRTPLPELLAGVDVVILSPGPGHPAVPADVGLAPALVETLAGPGYEHVVLFGVCLGHQLLAHLAGAQVGRAPEPWHGRLAAVAHDGTGVFAGLPSPLTVTRYHSLAVDPAALEPGGAAHAAGWRRTAVSEDGVVQAMAHTSRPWVAVQFHPESVATEGGRALLANVLALAAPRWRVAVRSVPGALAGLGAGEAREAALEALFVDLFGDGAAPGEGAVWLDGRGERPTARWSVMAGPSGPLAQALLTGEREPAGRRSAGGADAGAEAGAPAGARGSFLAQAQRRLDDLRVDLRAHDPAEHGPFSLGWAGWLGYELREQTAPEAGASRHDVLTPDGRPAPLAQMVFCDRAVVLDRQTGAAHVLTLEPAQGPSPRWAREAERRLRAPARSVVAPPSPALPAVRLTGVTRADDEEAYTGLIDRARQAIAAGESYEVCLTTQVRGTLVADADADADADAAGGPGEADLAWAAYRVLRRASPVPFGAWLRMPGLDLCSMSPERLVAVTRAGDCTSSPIKGTRPRGATPEQDEALRTDLATAEKDRAENLMIVDLARHDLGRCAEPGSVRVDPLFDVETYSSVHQLVSTVRARLRPGLAATDVVAACFPPGSMTGAPKVRTMQLIDDWEHGARGAYSGAIGWLGLDGAADLSVVIRTLVVGREPLPGGGLPASYGVGGAIVALSDTAAELAELDTKLAALRPLLGPA